MWVHGLAYVLTGQHFVRDLHFPWDYGLRTDVQLLCRRRGGELPFEFMLGLWERLDVRDRELEIEQEAMS